MNTEAFENAAKESFKMYESAVDGALKYQEKLLKGVEVIANSNYDEINRTPKDLVFQVDKMERMRSAFQGSKEMPTRC